MGLKEILIGLVVFTAIMLTAILLIGDLNNSYPSANIDEDDAVFSQVYNLSDDLDTIGQGVKEPFFEEGDTDETRTEDSLFLSGFRAIQSLGSLFGTVGSIIQAVAIRIGIPKFFVTLGVAAFTIIFIFSIILLIFRLKG